MWLMTVTRYRLAVRSVRGVGQTAAHLPADA